MTLRRLATGFAGLCGAILLSFVLGFAGFVVAIHQTPGPLPTADGIVALTGGADRIETALQLLEAGKAKTLLVSGVAHGAGLGDMARRAELNAATLAPHVTLGRVATTTLGNARETAEWARANDLHSLIIVTASYHMPRAMLEMRREMPSMQLYPAPVQSPAMQRATTMRLLLAEYAKLVAAWFGLSHVVSHPIALVRFFPVDNSVHG